MATLTAPQFQIENVGWDTEDPPLRPVRPRRRGTGLQVGQAHFRTPHPGPPVERPTRPELASSVQASGVSLPTPGAASEIATQKWPRC